MAIGFYGVNPVQVADFERSAAPPIGSRWRLGAEVFDVFGVSDGWVKLHNDTKTYFHHYDQWPGEWREVREARRHCERCDGSGFVGIADVPFTVEPCPSGCHFSPDLVQIHLAVLPRGWRMHRLAAAFVAIAEAMQTPQGRRVLEVQQKEATPRGPFKGPALLGRPARWSGGRR